MAGLTAARATQYVGGPQDTVQRSSEPVQEIRRGVPVKGGVKVWAGSMVCLNAGFLAPYTVATGLHPVGMAMATVDNTGGADGALSCDVREGEFLWDNSGGDPVAAADTGKLVFGADDHTIAKTNGGNTLSPAGVLSKVTSAGAWVLQRLGIREA